MRSAGACLQGKHSRRQLDSVLRVCSGLFKAAPASLPAVVLLLLSGVSRAQPPPLLPGSCNFELDTCGYTSDPDYGMWSMNEEGTRSGTRTSNVLQFRLVGRVFSV